MHLDWGSRKRAPPPIMACWLPGGAVGVMNSRLGVERDGSIFI
jgi:hypothetical protein